MTINVVQFQWTRRKKARLTRFKERREEMQAPGPTDLGALSLDCTHQSPEQSPPDRMAQERRGQFSLQFKKGDEGFRKLSSF